ncbi:MAG: ATP-binding protein, partial [Christensenella sp.]
MNLGQETEQIEFKKSTSELKEGVASIASILNKHGEGTLYFGVASNGDVVGQDVAESTLRQISQAIGSSIEPRISPSIEKLTDNNGHDYVCVSFSGAQAPYSCKSVFRVRIADEDVAMTAAQIEAMIIARFNADNPWDRRASARPISDISEEILRAYIARGNARKRIPFEFTTVEDVLSRLDLLIDGRLTNAASVLFCPSKNIQLKMGILATHTRTEILDLHQEEGTVFYLVDRATAYIANNTRTRFIINDFGPRDEMPELPPKAVKEALMNAYAHRDWASAGCVQVDIFNDAVEILSPGWFIDGQDPEEHLRGDSTSSKSRNELITKALYRSGDIESYGTGIPRIKEFCAEAGVQIEYLKTPDGTKLIFHRNDAFTGESASNPPAIRQQSPESASNPPAIRQQSPISDAKSHIARYSLSKNEQLVCGYLEKQGESKASAIEEFLQI